MSVESATSYAGVAFYDDGCLLSHDRSAKQRKVQYWSSFIQIRFFGEIVICSLHAAITHVDNSDAHNNCDRYRHHRQ